jgi:hypothetical protein
VPCSRSLLSCHSPVSAFPSLVADADILHVPNSLSLPTGSLLTWAAAWTSTAPVQPSVDRASA